MIDDLMNVVMDPLFGANGGLNYKSVFSLPGVTFGVDYH